jgi:hypothetical protein
MHTHYQPASEIPHIGRPVRGHSFDELTGELADGEVLFELVERPNQPVFAVLLNSHETFEEFARLAALEPGFQRDRYFAVDWSDAEDGTDQLPEDWHVANL